MRKKVLLAILVIASFSLLAQKKLINNSDQDILLLSVAGDVINISANDSAEITPPTDDIYYVYRRLSNDPQVVEKIGFCFLSTRGENLFYSPDNKVPVFIQNNSSNELLLEYGDMAIVMPPGHRYCAHGLTIEPSMKTLVYLSLNGAVLPKAEQKLLNFQFDGQSLSAEIDQ